ncbi:MAG TPA: hypothetical protein DDW73_16100 [Rhizobium sp.]|jgi:hypothetical protein|nr:hypothetical protein [Rhizobium sp.]
MARRKADPGIDFSLNDLAVAAGLSKRVTQFLADNAAFEGLTQMQKLNVAAAVGGVSAANISPLLAMKLIKIVIRLETNANEIPSGFKFIGRNLPQDKIKTLIDADEYYIHRLLMECPEIYTQGVGRRGDFVVEIVNGELVFTGSKDLTSISNFDCQSREMHFSGWITNIERGSEPDFIHMANKFNLNDLCDDETGKFDPILAEHEQSMQLCRANAVSRLTLNLSLAVRNGFDRLHAFRFGERDIA